MALAHPDGKHIVVSYAGGFRVFALRDDGFVLQRDNRLGVSPFSMDISPDGDRIVAALVALNDQSYPLAVRGRDGETVWQIPKPRHNDGWSTALVWSEADAELVGVLNAGPFTARDLSTGHERWWVRRMPSQICATPAVNDGVIYLTGTGVFGERHELLSSPDFDKAISADGYSGAHQDEPSTGACSPAKLGAVSAYELNEP